MLPFIIALFRHKIIQSQLSSFFNRINVIHGNRLFSQGRNSNRIIRINNDIIKLHFKDLGLIRGKNGIKQSSFELTIYYREIKLGTFHGFSEQYNASLILYGKFDKENRAYVLLFNLCQPNSHFLIKKTDDLTWNITKLNPEMNIIEKVNDFFSFQPMPSGFEYMILSLILFLIYCLTIVIKFIFKKYRRGRITHGL